jgi:hypothetical protein
MSDYGSFQDEGKGIPGYWATTGVMPGAGSGMQDEGKGIPGYWATTGVMPAAGLSVQGQGTGLAPGQLRPGVNTRDAGIGPPLRRFSNGASPGSTANQVAPPRQPRTRRPRYDQPRPQVRVTRSQPVRATRSQRATILTTFGLWLAVSLISGFLAYKAVSVLDPSGSYATDLWFLGSWFSAVVAAGSFIANLLDDY